MVAFGEWLAWRSAEFGGPSPSSYSGWIISSDGTKRLTVLDHPPDVVVNVSRMEWAPNDDLLFVVETLVDKNRDDFLRRFLLIDVKASKVGASYEFDTPYFNSDFPAQFVWLPDEQGVVVYENDLSDGLWLPQVVSLFTGRNVKTETYSAWMAFGFSPDGKFTYISPDERVQRQMNSDNDGDWYI